MAIRPARSGVALVAFLGVLASSGCRLRDTSIKPSAESQRENHRAVTRTETLLFQGLQAFRVSPGGQGHVAADNTGPYGRAWTKCTNLALDILTELVAEQRALHTAEVAAQNVSQVLTTLERLRTFAGIFPEFIKLEGAPHAEVKAGAIRYSSIDSAWVTLALSVAEARYRSERPELARRAGELVRRQNYTALLDENRLLGGLSVDARSGRVVERAAFAYGDRNSEARPLVLALVGLGKVPVSVWHAMSYRWTLRNGLPVASGYRESAFVELSGQLFFDEMALAPRSLGLSHENYVKASAEVARQRGHTIWGYAPACAPPSGYAEFGLDNPDVVAPYAAALLSTTGIRRAASNLSKVLEGVGASGAPLADSLDPITRQPVCNEARMLDQSLLFLALNVDTLRALSRRTVWYTSAEVHLREMDRSHGPELTSLAVKSENVVK